jgi:hypothetical protein
MEINMVRFKVVRTVQKIAFVSTALILTPASLNISATEQVSPDTAVLEWAAMNANCHGTPLQNERNAQCKRRDELQAYLLNQGCVLTSQDVWVSPAQTHYFESVVFKAGMQASANPKSSASIKQEMMMMLHTKMKDPQIFAIWNEATIRVGLQRQSPHGYPLMNDLMLELAQKYAGSQDPALMLGRP